MWSSVIAVLGTLAGVLVTGGLAHWAARAARREARQDQAGQARLEAVVALAHALSDHRLASWKAWQAALTGADEDWVRELREAAHGTRSAVTDPAVRVRLLYPDAPQVREAATAAATATYALRTAATVEELQELRAAAVAATDRLVDVAGAHLAAVTGEKRPKKQVTGPTPLSAVQ
ncbi:protein kilB [Streptosporangium jomthongense]|uniref:Protein kilB n=1 Tax=Streptosporangium jomthongense TaxID=1193683 RepID=A0ABV8FH93_9ACTN